MKPSCTFNKICFVLLTALLIFSLSGCSKSVVKNQSQPAGYPIAADVQTTAQRTIVPGPIPSTAINLWEISKYDSIRLWQLDVWPGPSL